MLFVVKENSRFDIIVIIRRCMNLVTKNIFLWLEVNMVVYINLWMGDSIQHTPKPKFIMEDHKI